jgi:hypothetical protein
VAAAPEVRIVNLVNNDFEKQFELQPEVAAADRRKAWSGQFDCCGRLPTTITDDDTVWDETVTSTEGDNAPDWEQETIFVKPLEGGLESLGSGEYTIKRGSEAFLMMY